MYIALFKRIVNLLVSPVKEWDNVEVENKELSEIFTSFVLPLVGLAALAAFLREAFADGAFSLVMALRQAASLFAALLGGLFAALWLMPRLYGHFGASKDKWFAFLAYVSGVYYLAEVAVAMVPHLYWLRLVAVAVAFIAWHWAEIEKPLQKAVFAVATSLLVVGTPWCILLGFKYIAHLQL